MAKLVSDLSSLLKKNFLTGVFVILPLGVVAWVLVSLLTALWRLHTWVPDSFKPEAILHDDQLALVMNLAFTVAAALILALGISFLGWSSKQYLGRKVLEAIGEIIQRIPVVRSVYSALDQLLKTLASGGGQQFSRVVYIEYPRKGVWALAFVTGPAKGPGVPEHHLNVYVPTTPNPTSGFHLLVAESEVRESHLRVEDAFKTILSLGIAQTEGNPRA